jgi:hypothetical protein
MSAALLALRNAIATNTLTALQQGALTTALDEIIPTFPVPDDTSSALPPSDEVDARTWISALYSIQGNGGAPLTLSRVVSLNDIATKSLPAPFAPGVSKVLLVADITPQSSGLLIVSINVDVIEDAPGVPGIALFYVDDLTAITGGTVVAPGLTAEPVSTTPAFGAGVAIFAAEAISFNDGANPNTAIVIMAGIPVQAVVGHRSGIIVVAHDTGAQNWTSLSASVSVVEE